MNNIEITEFSSEEGFWAHCEVAALIINELGLNPHTKHHIRTAIREASNKVTNQKGSGKNIATLISESVYFKIQQSITIGFVLEHVVPVSYLNAQVLSLPVVTKESIGQVLQQWTTLSVITEEEHKKLNDLKLGSSMPADWNGKDKFARYKKAGIELKDICYKDAAKSS